MRFFLLALLAVATYSRGTVFHEYSNMAFFSSPVDADAVRKLVHPDLQVDTYQGTAWVSLVASQLTKTRLDGLPVPLLKPYELQLRTYVTGPKGRKGVWLFDLFLSDILTVTGGTVLYFENTIRVVLGKTKVTHSNTSWTAAGNDLPVTNTASGNFKAQLEIIPEASTNDATGLSFFLERFTWFGARPKTNDLVVLPLKNVSFAGLPRQVVVSDLSTSVLGPLGFGPELDASTCKSSQWACFYVGKSVATFTGPFKP